uniref:Coiled-coil domain-containing protein 102A-like n=1 Tax=Geotrypetes seraphini TaxID=260995 RepID=A0A6P8PC25_GEOSA|nr:coiled-coil domain-containing protein 102A-like [Geotrypetes seraphini]
MSRKNLHRDSMGSDSKGQIKAGLPKASPPSSPLKSPVATAQSSLESSHPLRDHQRCREELAETKLVASNLEKTVRWWAECTSKWRERWSRASAERNRAKKEVRALRQQVEQLGREMQELREQLEEARKRQSRGTVDGERLNAPKALPGGERASETQEQAGEKSSKEEQVGKTPPTVRGETDVDGEKWSTKAHEELARERWSAQRDVIGSPKASWTSSALTT